MFGANRKKYMEAGLEGDYAAAVDESGGLYYSQPSVFPPHRADKDVSGAVADLVGAGEVSGMPLSFR